MTARAFGAPLAGVVGAALAGAAAFVAVRRALRRGNTRVLRVRP